VKGLKPVILVNAGGQMAAMTVPAAIMVGIGEPMTDYHYGNDVVLKPGTKLTVKDNGEGPDGGVPSDRPEVSCCPGNAAPRPAEPCSSR
jgi:hypothetical protein